MQNRNHYVYILTNSGNNVFYVGYTSDIERRIYEHKNHLIKGFTDNYNVTKCVFVEMFSNAKDAIESEKKIKKLSRVNKFKLIKTINPEIKDLYN